VPTVLTRVQQSGLARYRQNKWISRVAPVGGQTEIRKPEGTSQRKKTTMKKLMIAAAVAAMIGGVQAVTCVTGKVCVKDECTGEKICDIVEGAGTAHKVAITLKTTANKSKVSKKACEDADCVYWRQQTTKKINGLIWEQLDECNGCVPFGANSVFWTSEKMLDVEFAIGVGLIGAGVNSKKIEAYGSLSGDEFGALSWAGFGSMAASTKKNQCEDDDCVMYVKSISGGIAGALLPAEWNNICQDCELIGYEGCCDDMQLENTAAYGTIKITYDTATAKKVAVADDAADPTKFNKFPAAVFFDPVTKEPVDPADFVQDVAIEE
jgi:hypothetical protein